LIEHVFEEGDACKQRGDAGSIEIQADGDLRFEPRSALASGSDGLDALRRIVAEAPRHLLPGGGLLVEHGWRQGGPVRDLFARAGFHAIRTEQDLEQRDRVTLGFTP
jgi:release factor glutamine methyltransferase